MDPKNQYEDRNDYDPDPFDDWDDEYDWWDDDEDYWHNEESDE